MKKNRPTTLSQHPENKPFIPGLRKKHMEGLGVFLVALFVIIFGYLQFRMFNPLWVLTAFFIVYIYFNAVLIRERAWLHLPEKVFEKRLFQGSFLMRAITVLVIVFVAQITWGRPIWVSATDGMRYWRVSREVAAVVWDQGIMGIYPHVMAEYGSFDNTGVPIIIGLFLIFVPNSVILASLFVAFMGSFSVKYIYRTAAMLFEPSTARLAGLLAAFMPLSLLYDSILMKESFVVFFTSFSIYLSTKFILRGRFSFWDIILLSISVFAIFFFRTAAGAVVVASMILFFLVNNVRGNPLKAWIIGFTIITVLVYFLSSMGHLDYVLGRLEGGMDAGETRIAGVERRSNWTNLSLGPVFLILSHFAPFPPMVELNPIWGHDITYYWLPGLVSWNILSFYALLGLWHMIRNNPRPKLMVLGYTIGFTLVLGFTAMFTMVRIGWNVIPMMMIPAAVGLKNYRSIKTFYLALLIAGMLIVAWNIFRGIGRGVL